MARSKTQSLTDKQELVLTRLLAGDTVTGAAAAGGVHRSTVHNWLTADLAFIAAYNAGKAALKEEAAISVLSLVPAAVTAVRGALEGADGKTGLAVLRGLGLLPGHAPSDGSTSLEELENEARRKEERRKRDKWLAESGLTEADYWRLQGLTP